MFGRCFPLSGCRLCVTVFKPENQIKKITEFRPVSPTTRAHSFLSQKMGWNEAFFSLVISITHVCLSNITTSLRNYSDKHLHTLLDDFIFQNALCAPLKCSVCCPFIAFCVLRFFIFRQRNGCERFIFFVRFLCVCFVNARSPARSPARSNPCNSPTK